MKTKTRTNTSTPHTSATIGGVRANGVNQHKHPNTPSQEWWGATEAQTEAHTSTPHTLARTSGVQAEGTHKHTNPNTPARIGALNAKVRIDTPTSRR